MIDVVISGAAGRMGRAVSQAVTETDGMRITGALGAPNRAYTNKDLGDLHGFDSKGIVIRDDIETVLASGQTWVEFSPPDATVTHAERVKDFGLPLVIGTTGLSEKQKEDISAWSEHMPCLIAPNMSVGANLLFKLAEVISGTLPDFDVEIIEAHHRFKRDAPSGTANHLAECITRARGSASTERTAYGRGPSSGIRQSDEIGIHSVRAGDIVGEHTVLFSDLGERIEITHRVQNIDTFAYGTIQAIRFLQNRSPGLYTMADVIENMIIAV